MKRRAAAGFDQAAQAAAKAEQVTIAPEKRAEEKQIAAEKRADERAAKAVPQAAPVAQIVIVPVPQPQTVNGTATIPEVSVAEAARQARITKAVREAKEKAERDNPPPPQ